jgi:TonB family protein
VFDFASAAARPSSRFLSVSAILHCAVAAALLTLHFAPAVRVGYARRLTPLISAIELHRSAPPKPRKVAIKPVEVASVPVLRPVLATVTLAVIIPAAPLPGDPPRINLPMIESPAIEPAAPRVFKTDNFSNATAEAPLTIATLVAKPAGFGTIETSPTATSTRALSTGSFGSASSAVLPERRVISRGGFGDVQVASNGPVARPADVAPATTAVEILFKPRPAYTAEARRLQIEGEVVLEIQFTASGEARLVRVVQGLGHGLDESASDAARQIRFRPALRASASVDSIALVHIQFQLAY